MQARIVGLGQWIPPEVRDNSAWPAEFVTRGRRSPDRELVDVDAADSSPEDRIALDYFAAESADPFLGTTRRHIAPASMTAPEAEAYAGEQALQQAGVGARELDVIISWSAVPDRIVPASAAKVAHILNATSAYAFGMDAACATPIAQLEVASALIQAGRAKRVLLTQSHLITRTFPLLHPASPNVGDAATAMLICAGEEPSLLASIGRTHGEYYEAVTWRRGSDGDTPWWEAGPAFYLGSHDREAAAKLVRSTVRIAADTIRELMPLAGLAIDEVEVLASVQPRRWIPKAIAEALGVSIQVPQTFDELAHLGGCGVLTNLIHAQHTGTLKPGTHIVLYAQGAGFTRAAALIRW